MSMYKTKGERVNGATMTPTLQYQARAIYTNRYTGEHVPYWAKGTRACGCPYALQFATDADWLAHTVFTVNRDGWFTDDCESTPTWPYGNGNRPACKAHSL